VLFKHLIQPGRDDACAEVTAAAHAVRGHVDRPTVFNNDNVNSPTDAASFAKKMNRQQGSCRTAAGNGDNVVASQRRCSV
jgi:hypothetical protein